ncbi:MAG: sensor histidine kinase [Synergistetes bacterium]|nr:sensor histidine kinase [Synergistota bacterium]MDW8191597.1 sensor histidine kinase [Synergistota bacterium]
MRLRLQTKVMLLAFTIVVICLSSTAFFTIRIVSDSIEKQMAINVMNVARSVATDPFVISAFYSERPEEILQPYAERIRRNSTNIEFITIINMNSERYSHPNPQNIRKKFVGGDEGRALRGETYISKAVGTLGPSLRALTPIKDGDKQIGAVAVGTLTKDIRKVQWEVAKNVVIIMFFAMAIGVAGSYLLSKNIKKDIFGLEPYQIAKMLEEKNVILDAVVEGIIAVDKEGKITLMNNAAKRIVGVEEKESVIGKDVEELIPTSRLKVVLRTGIPERDDEQVVNGTSIITNRVPIVVNGRVEGAIASFRLKTDLEHLGEQLTGYKQVVDTLRAQAHEFMNHMHVVAGLISLGQTSDALSFIYDELGAQHGFTGQVTRSIKDKKVAALLLGKYSRASEIGARLYLDEGSELYEDHGHVSSGELVTILGNLIENSIDALSMIDKGNKVVGIYLKERKDYIFIKVYDSGPGIAKDILPRIFEKGFTTKRDGKGMGLFMVKQIVERKGGSVEVRSSANSGTVFVVKIPRRCGV